jgi:DNA repair protein RadC
MHSSFKAAEVELIYRSKIKPKDRIQIPDSRTAYQVLKSTWDENKIELLEQFKIVLLDRNMGCLGVAEIGRGGKHQCIADPKLIFVAALKANAEAIILAHNHPSGNLKASKQDLALTTDLIAASKLLDIKIVDHLIITSDGYTSFEKDKLVPF